MVFLKDEASFRSFKAKQRGSRGRKEAQDGGFFGVPGRVLFKLLGVASIVGGPVDSWGPVEFGKTINESFNFLLNYGGPGRMFGKFL